MKKLCIMLIAIILVSTTAFYGFGFGTTTPSVEVKTLTDIGNATIAGTGAFYDDGMLRYDNTGNTIGYQYDQSASLLEFDIIFDNLAWPSWFSLTFKANGFDRTQSPNLTQKGYSFVVYASGAVEVWKTGMTPITGAIPSFSQGVKYRFKLGAYNDGQKVKLYMSVNDTVIVDAYDTNGAFLAGNWFNICSDGSVTARIFSTKKEIIPDYYTYTLSTIGNYPTCTDSGASYDKYKNVYLTGSAGTIGWYQALKSYSVEINMNWTEFGAGSNIWLAMRASGFDRANGPGLAEKGYVIRIGQMGVLDLYRSGTYVSGGGWAYAQGVDHVFEFGCVDLDENRTWVFVNVNGLPALSYIDNNSIKTDGWFTFNGDGIVNCTMTSVTTKVTPLVTKVSETEQNYQITTYFNNTISYTDMAYSDFSDVLLDAIQLNGTSVKDLNNVYYAKDGQDNVNAVSLEYVENKLIVKVAKNLYLKSNNSATTFEFFELTIKKTGSGTGLICPSGYSLKKTYYYTAE